GGGWGRPAAKLPGTEPASEQVGTPPGESRRWAGGSRWHPAGAVGGDGGGAVRDPEGGGRLPAARPELSERAAGLLDGGCRGKGSADSGAAGWETCRASRRLGVRRGGRGIPRGRECAECGEEGRGAKPGLRDLHLGVNRPAERS